MEVAIIGAGISGLGAAYTLVKAGFTRVTIFEAQDYIGGRIKSLQHDDGYLELGAQWIHGQEGNIIYEMASQRDLIASTESIEGDGYFCTQNGLKIDSGLVNQVIIFLDTIKTSLSNGDYKRDFHRNGKVITKDETNGQESFRECPDIITSVGEVFRVSFNKWISTKKFKSPQDYQLTQGIFNWFMKFEAIDNSCSSLDQLSVISYSLYHNCEGVPLNNFKSGYSSLINSLLEDIPEVLIKTSCPVSRIIYPTINNFTGDNCNRVILVLEDGSKVTTNHVIVTNSIGFLKTNMDTFFEPQLPPVKRLLISTMGFDSVNKIYLIFEKPFWKPCDHGFQLIWCNDNDEQSANDQYPPWVYDVSGIDTVNGQPNVLVGWIGGKGAELIEHEDDQSLINIFHSLLIKFLSSSVINHQPIPKPIKTVRSAWFSNKYMCGSYSHRTINFAKLNCPLNELTNPLTISYQPPDQQSTTKLATIAWPLVLFAGEAMEEKFFSTTHGALSSGIREASRLLQFWKQHQLN